MTKYHHEEHMTLTNPVQPRSPHLWVIFDKKSLYAETKVHSGGSTSPSDLTLLIIRLDVSCSWRTNTNPGRSTKSKRTNTQLLISIHFLSLLDPILVFCKGHLMEAMEENQNSPKSLYILRAFMIIENLHPCLID